MRVACAQLISATLVFLGVQPASGQPAPLPTCHAVAATAENRSISRQVVETAVRQYFEAWNEPYTDLRLKAVEAAFAPDASYLDPERLAQGRMAIAEMIGAAQQEILQSFAAFLFEPAGQIDSHHGQVRIGWALKGPTGAVIATGVTFAALDAGGAIRCATGFATPSSS